jgi:hypothetical protein
MSLTYSSYVTSLANLLVVSPIDPNFVSALSNIIDDAEQRCYRELDLLNTVVSDASAVLTPNSRNFTLPQSRGRFVVSESINVFTPVGLTTNRNQLVPVTREFLDAVWPNDAAASAPSVPTYYAMISDQDIIVGPPPDASYTMEVVGTIRPTPISPSNTTTYLSLYLSDLFLAASMIFGAAYQMNFSDVSDNPQQSVSWEAHFTKLLASANIEEQRKRYASQAWTAKQPAPLATPPRA